MSGFYIALGLSVLVGMGVFTKSTCTSLSKRLREL